MITKRTPQAASPLASWLSYLENLHGETIDLDLERVSQAMARPGVPKPTSLMLTITSTNDEGTTCRMLESILMAVGYRVDVYSSPHLVRYTRYARIRGQESPEPAHTTSFAETESVRGDTSLTYFEYGTFSALRLFKQAQLDVMTLGVRLGGHLDTTSIVGIDVAAVTGIALDHINWLGPGRESIGREKTGIFRSEKPAIIGGSEMPSTVTDVAQEKGALLQRRGIKQNYSVIDHDWMFSDARGTLENLPLLLVPQPNAAAVLTALRVNGLEVSESVIRDGITSIILPGRFQTVSESPRVIFDVAYNPHAAEYLTGRMKALPKDGRVLAVIGMLHDKGIAGTLAWLEGVVDDWCCAPLEGPRGATVGQLLEYLGNGKSFDSVAQAWGAVMTDAKAEDTMLICGSFHTVVCVMEVIDARGSGGK